MMKFLDLLPKTRQRVDLLAPPFAGHLHPILAIGRQLALRHEVRIISTTGALQRIEAAGLTGIALLGANERTLLEIANPEYAVRSNPIRLYRQFRAALSLLGQFRQELEALYRATRAPDVMIADFTLPVAGAVAATLDIPWWTSLPSPCALETSDGPPGYCGGLFPANNWLDRLSHAIARKKVRVFKRGIFYLFRKPLRRMGLSRLYREDGSEAAYSPDCILALADEALEFKRSWPAAVRFIGPALYTPACHAPAPAFCPGRRHILVTLGTHLAWHKDQVVAAILALARSRPEWEFHFSDGNPALAMVRLSENFVRLPYVHYSDHLQYYDAVIHHGGAGVMYYCLRYNKPALIYPVDYDQFDHAARLHHAGKGIWLKGGLAALETAGVLLDQLIGDRT